MEETDLLSIGGRCYLTLFRPTWAVQCLSTWCWPFGSRPALFGFIAIGAYLHTKQVCMQVLTKSQRGPRAEEEVR